MQLNILHMPTSNTIHQRKNLLFSITTTCDPDHSCEVNEVFSQDHVEYRVGTMTKDTTGFIIQLWILHFFYKMWFWHSQPHSQNSFLSFINGQGFNILSLTNCIMYNISINPLHKVTLYALQMMVQLYQNMQYYTGDNTVVPNWSIHELLQQDAQILRVTP
jgi:hypothetical protein